MLLQFFGVFVTIKCMKAQDRRKRIVEFVRSRAPARTAQVTEFVQETIGLDVDRVTISRDLALLVQEGVLSSSGSGPATAYTLSNQYALLGSIDVEAYFAIPQDARNIYDKFSFEVFEKLRVKLFSDQEFESLAMFDEEFRQKNTSLSPVQHAKELERIMIEFSWKSSQIEGNTYSLLDTELLLKEQKVAQGKTAEETQMILNHKEAFDFIIEHSHEFLSPSRAHIEQIHRILVKGLGVREGIRHRAVGITGTNYRPLDNIHQIDEAFSAYIALCAEKGDGFEKALLSLVLLAYLQPFEDGNKRVARTVCNGILLAHKSAPLSFRAVDEVEYKKAKLLFYEQHSLWYIKQLFMEQYAFAAKNYF